MRTRVKFLSLSYSKSIEGAYSCILSTIDKKNIIVAIIKSKDASIIALKNEGLISPTNITHDFLENSFNIFGIEVIEVYIHSMLDGIFICSALLNNGIIEQYIDLNIADAIILSLIYNCDMYVSEEILETCGIISDTIMDLPIRIPDIDILLFDEEVNDDLYNDIKIPKTSEPSKEDLINGMNTAIEEEDYEKAIYYRDELKKRFNYE